MFIHKKLALSSNRNIYSAIVSTFLDEYRKSSTTLKFIIILISNLLFFSPNRDDRYSNHFFLGFPVLFPVSSISVFPTECPISLFCGFSSSPILRIWLQIEIFPRNQACFSLINGDHLDNSSHHQCQTNLM